MKKRHKKMAGCARRCRVSFTYMVRAGRVSEITEAQWGRALKVRAWYKNFKAVRYVR